RTSYWNLINVAPFGRWCFGRVFKFSLTSFFQCRNLTTSLLNKRGIFTWQSIIYELFKMKAALKLPTAVLLALLAVSCNTPGPDPDLVIGKVPPKGPTTP